MASVRFTQPPLVEIAFSVEFIAPDFSSVHLGLYWESIRSEFPLQQDSQPIILEEYGNSTPPLRRVGFVSNDRSKIIQLQENLFIFNWRYNSQDETHHFKNILAQLIGYWNRFQEWWLNLEGEPIEVQQYELTYFNAIDQENSGWHNAKDHAKVFNFIEPKWSGFLNVPESLDIQMNFLLPNHLGTLSVRVDQLSISSDDDEEEVTSESEDVVFFKLLAQSTDTKISITEWFTSTHDYIVKAFLELTKEDAQKLWGRYDY
jgi:uncharacterized protein (TIGR04255 family)